MRVYLEFGTGSRIEHATAIVNQPHQNYATNTNATYAQLFSFQAELVHV